MNNKNNVIAIVAVIVILIIGVGLVYYYKAPAGDAMMSDNTSVPADNTATPGTSGGSNTTPGTANNTSAGTNPEFVFTDYTLRVGQPTMVNGVKITPLAIEQDSRCAINVQCIQAGSVRVSTKFEFNSFSTTEAYVTGVEKTIYGVTGTIVATSPDKVSGKEIKQSDYSFTLRVKTKA